jgi:hypothetical protein
VLASGAFFHYKTRRKQGNMRCCMLSSGWFTGICSLNANNSEHCSIFIGVYVWCIYHQHQNHHHPHTLYYKMIQNNVSSFVHVGFEFLPTVLLNIQVLWGVVVCWSDHQWPWCSVPEDWSGVCVWCSQKV